VTQLANRWTIWDKLIAGMRFSQTVSRIPDGAVVCDLGCGFDGAFLRALSGRIAAGYGFDQKVSEGEFGNVKLATANLGDGIPIPKNTVDCVTMLALLEHLDEPAKLLSEAHRILKAGGTIIATTPPPRAKWLLEFLAFTIGIISKEEILDHKHYYAPSELVALFRQAGFAEVKVSHFLLGYNQLVVAAKANTAGDL
jgi:SAM-dependent methyltransferase